jgi:hypothetical protein
MELSLIISLISIVIVVATFVLGRKDKSNKDVASEQYKSGQLDMQLQTIMKKLDKIEDKLDNMESETKRIVQEELEKHVLKYHS